VWTEFDAAGCRDLERVMGIEPTLFAWEAEVLPLNYTRKSWTGSSIQSLIDISQDLNEALGCRAAKAQTLPNRPSAQVL
jgi:hypothetical protein